MAKISTKNLTNLTNIAALQKLCKALATLDAIICKEREYRYYFYNKDWDIGCKEEFFHMLNGSGDEFQVLFTTDGAIINGFAHESEMSNWVNEKQEIWEGVLYNLPMEFQHFIFWEPIQSIGTTFCIWRKFEDEKWQIGEIEFPESEFGDGSEYLIYILDNQPKTYWEWAIDYYEDALNKHELELHSIQRIYDFETLTKELILEIQPAFDDFEGLKIDLEQIGYPYCF